MNKINRISILIFICLSFALAGCGSQVDQQVSTNGAPTNVSPQPTKTQQPLIKPATIPEWCSNPPLNTVYRIYACGIFIDTNSNGSVLDEMIVPLESIVVLPQN